MVVVVSCNRRRLSSANPLRCPLGVDEVSIESLDADDDVASERTASHNTASSDHFHAARGDRPISLVIIPNKK
jgi:hypothetical protein